MIVVVGSPSYGSVVKHLDDVIYTNGGRELWRHPWWRGLNKEFHEKMNEIKMIMFTGGEDVHPDYYGGSDPDGVSYTNKSRDNRESAIFDLASTYNIKLTGICRGFQFLNVMCGGQMYQHIWMHAGMYHDVMQLSTGRMNEMMSTHHQLVKLPEDAIPVAVSHPRRSHGYIGPDGKVITDKGDYPKAEVESAIFPNYNAFGVQYHPEMMPAEHEGRIFYEKTLIQDFFSLDMETFINRHGGRNHDEGIGKRTATAGTS